MWEYIVLGQIPGTNLQIGFYAFVIIVAAVYSGRFGINLKHTFEHRQKSMLVAKTVVASSVLRPDPEPVQLELL
jgi:hypothetical protein